MLATLFLVTTTLLFPVLQDKPKDLIVGKWEAGAPNSKSDDKIIIEFQKDGKLTVSFGPMKAEGKYKFTDDNTMDVEINFGGDSKTQKLKVKVTKDELITTDEKGKEEKFKRAK